jgi:predicted nuclease of predicted toxin-antitoxin system
MPDRIRFHLDESVDPGIAAALQRYGIDVTTSQEAGLLHRPDGEHWAFGKQQDRVLVTHDADFLRLARREPLHSGVAYCAMNQRSIGEIIRRLIAIHGTRTPGEMKGRVEFLLWAATARSRRYSR